MDVLDIRTNAAPSTWTDSDTGLATVLHPIMWVANIPVAGAPSFLQHSLFTGKMGSGSTRTHKFAPEGNDGVITIYDSETPTRNIRTQTLLEGIFTTDGIKITPKPDDSDTTYIVSVEPIVADPPSIVPASQRQARLTNKRAQEIFRYEPHGRWATVNRFCDDFNYHPNIWTRTTPATLIYYTSTEVTTGSATPRITIADPTVTGHWNPGGRAIIECDDGVNDLERLEGAEMWQIRESGPTNLSALFLFAKIQIHENLTDVSVRLGFATLANARRFWFEFNTTNSPAANWWFKTDDGAAGTVSQNLGFAAALDTDILMYMALDPFANSGTGSVHGYLEQGASKSTYTGSTMPGSGATHLDRMMVFAEVQTLAAADVMVMTIDYWEIWNEVLLSGASS
jgi:hypothetical protein